MRSVTPAELATIGDAPDADRTLYQVVFGTEDWIVPRDEGRTFDRAEYESYPDRYRSDFARYLDHLTVLITGIYWEPGCPRLVTYDDVRTGARLRVIGDVSLDIEGAIEFTVKATEPDDPVYVVGPDRVVRDGWEGPGVVVLAVDFLPTELPVDASTSFSEVLREFVPALAHVDLTAAWDDARLPEPLRRATIVWRGDLTPDYRYLESALSGIET